MLRAKQWIDFREEAQYRFVLDRLVRDLNSLRSEKASERTGTEPLKAGERIEQLDWKTLSELRKTLQDAVDAFHHEPEGNSTPNTNLKNSDIDEKMCFVVMPFGVESLNIVYEDFVKPVLEDRCQLRAERGDDVFGSNVIMDDIAQSIRRARLIVADLTGRNANVFYEVGIAHALNKRVLLMTQSIDDVPFDLRHRRALIYEYTPRGCKKLEKDLYENLRNMLNA